MCHGLTTLKHAFTHGLRSLSTITWSSTCSAAAVAGFEETLGVRMELCWDDGLRRHRLLLRLLLLRSCSSGAGLCHVVLRTCDLRLKNRSGLLLGLVGVLLLVLGLAESRVRSRSWTFSRRLRHTRLTLLLLYPFRLGWRRLAGAMADADRDGGWFTSRTLRCNGCCCPSTAKPFGSAAERGWRALAFGGVDVAAGIGAEAGPR